MTMYNKQLGALGEKLAIQYLNKKGYQIMEKNYQTRYGEIDIIATQNNRVTFFEVKARTSNDFGYPEEAINWLKLYHFENSVQAYLAYHPLENKEISLDAISVELNLGTHKAKINHWENISQ